MVLLIFHLMIYGTYKILFLLWKKYKKKNHHLTIYFPERVSLAMGGELIS